MQNSIILFRFYKDFEVCAARIKILQALNPDMPIYGLYGGPAGHLKQAKALLKDSLINIQASPDGKRHWKWLHPELTLKHWYRTYGKNIDFDYLYDYEWDILTAAPLAEIYPKVDQRTIALCAIDKFTPEIEQRWHWTSHPDRRPQYLKFMEYMKQTYALESLEFASLGPGPLLSRQFLEAFSQTEDVDFVLSEIAYPAYAQALGFKLTNNRLMPNGFNTKHWEKYFNCNNLTIPLGTIKRQLAKPDGVRAFHPVKYLITLDELNRLKARRAYHRKHRLLHRLLALPRSLLGR